MKIPPDGTSRTSHHSASPLPGTELAPGTRVTVRVLAQHTSDTLSVEIGGKMLTAHLAGRSVLPGLHSLVVVRTAPVLTLALDMPEPSEQHQARLDRYLRALGLPADQAGRDVVFAILTSLRHARRALVVRTLAMVRRLRIHRGRSDRRDARLAVELTDRGFDPDDATAAAPASLLIAAMAFPDHDERRRRQSGASSDGAAVELQSVITRQTAEPDHPLQLFNTLRSSAQLHWVVIPIRALRGGAGGEQSVDATLKLAVEPAGGRAVEARLDAETERSLYSFVWTRSGGWALAGACGASVDDQPHATATLRTLLARIGAARHTDTWVDRDGFRLVPAESDSAGFDVYV